MVVLSIVGVALGLIAASFGSRRAVTSALAAATAMRLSPALIGATVVAVGTDLPEIANSISAALNDHGDIVVGDAVGSAMTQVSLVFALLCVAARALPVDRATVLVVGGLATGGLLLGAVLVSDEVLSRRDGGVLVVAWVLGLILVRVFRGRADVEVVDGDEEAPRRDRRRALRDAAHATAWLAVVAVAATVLVESFVHLTDALGVPELVASAIVLSLGTSLPELFVDLTALRHGAAALAIGDLFGSSLLDATLSLGVGPALRAVTVSSTAAASCLVAAVIVLASTVVAMARPVHGRRSAARLFAIYLVGIGAMVVVTG